MFRQLSLAITALISISTQAANACTPAHEFKTITPGKLTVATMMIPPFLIPENNTLKGVDGELITKIAEMECLTVTPIVVDTRAVMQYVVSGQADVAVGNWFRTATRLKSMEMSDPVYLDSLAIYTKEGTQSLNALVESGKVVGTVQGYNWVSDLQKLFGSKIKLYPSPVALAQDLEAGRIEAGLDSFSGGLYAQQQGGFKGFKIVQAEPDQRVRASIEAAQIAFALVKGNDDVTKAINEDIAKLRDGKAIASALEKYGLSADDSNVGAPRAIE
ncbi:MAG: substrate-binding periplasmic protein [Pseudomonas sp.]|uniref:substrate-binding periplasmic protein n=1 Tax=Pseudomonas sp. TaxID=306 RepID=UPI003D6E246A